MNQVVNIIALIEVYLLMLWSSICWLIVLQNYDEAVWEEYEVAKQAALEADKAPPKKTTQELGFSKNPLAETSFQWHWSQRSNP